MTINQPKKQHVDLYAVVVNLLVATCFCLLIYLCLVKQADQVIAEGERNRAYVLQMQQESVSAEQHNSN